MIKTPKSNTNILSQQPPICDDCRRSEQLTNCDILYDDQCKLTLCRKCLIKKLQKNRMCTKCKKSLSEHRNRLKNPFKNRFMDQGSRRFDKEFGIRKEWEKYPEVSKQMIHLLAFLAMELPTKYENKHKREIKDICEQLKDEKNVVLGERTLALPSKINVIVRDDEEHDGRKACSYDLEENERKGIKQIFQAYY